MDHPLRRLDLNLLRVLVAVERSRSVTAAGRQLSLSQPATSNALARLRRAFDDVLFVRTPGGLAPTPVATRLAAAAARHLEALERDLTAPPAFDPATSRLTWRLSLSDLGEMAFLPAIADELLRAAPHTHIVNAAVAADDVGAALARREIDLAIGILKARERGVRTELLFSETYVALSAREGLPRQRGRELLERAGLIVAAPTATFHGGIERSLVRAGLEGRIAVRTRHFAAMPELLLAAPLIAVVPSSWARSVIEREPRLAAWPLPIPMPRYDVLALWHRATEGEPALDWLRTRLVARLSR
jgi:DNA-binding transcriptional LysR family regulator